MGNVNTMMFADDMLWEEDVEQIQRQLNIWIEHMKDRGLRITKYIREVMVVRKINYSEIPALPEELLKVVNQFTH